jgi:hypothetical protein
MKHARVTDKPEQRACGNMNCSQNQAKSQNTEVQIQSLGRHRHNTAVAAV